MIIRAAINDLPHHEEDIYVEPESRFWTLRDKYIVGNVTIDHHCSNYELKNLYIKGKLLVKDANWQASFQNIFVDESPGHGFQIGEPTRSTAGCALRFENCFSRWAKHWGWYVTNQLGLSMTTCSADVSGAGGFLIVSTSGKFHLTAESNPVGAWFYDAGGELSRGSFLTDSVEPLRISGGSTLKVL